jgi:hypothetical protein
MRAVLHAFAFAVTRGSKFRARQGRRRYAEIVNSPILGAAGPDECSLEGSRADLMPGTRDGQSRCQHARIVLSTSGHRAEERQQPFRLLNAT